MSCFCAGAATLCGKPGTERLVLGGLDVGDDQDDDDAIMVDVLIDGDSGCELESLTTALAAAVCWLASAA